MGKPAKGKTPAKGKAPAASKAPPSKKGTKAPPPSPRKEPVKKAAQGALCVACDRHHDGPVGERCPIQQQLRDERTAAASREKKADKYRAGYDQEETAAEAEESGEAGGDGHKEELGHPEAANGRCPPDTVVVVVPPGDRAPVPTLHLVGLALSVASFLYGAVIIWVGASCALPGVVLAALSVSSYREDPDRARFYCKAAAVLTGLAVLTATAFLVLFIVYLGHAFALYY